MLSLSKIVTLYLLTTPHSSSPSPGYPPLCFLSLWVWLLQIPHKNGFMPFLSFCEQLISLSIMSKFVHIVAYDRIFLFHDWIMFHPVSFLKKSLKSVTTGRAAHLCGSHAITHVALMQQQLKRERWVGAQGASISKIKLTYIWNSKVKGKSRM